MSDSASSSENSPRLIPYYAFIGKSQDFIVEYAHDVPQSLLVTFTILDAIGQRIDRVPGTQIGPKAIRALFPVFKEGGIYTVVPKFAHREDHNFPKFYLRVLTPQEAILNCLTPENGDTDNLEIEHNNSATLAAVLAYQIQTEQQEAQVNRDITDQVISHLLQSVNRPIIHLPKFMCGKYYNGNESLLHFGLRHQLVGTCDWLSKPKINNGFEESLQQVGYDGNNPLDLAYFFNMQWMVQRIQPKLETIIASSRSSFGDDSEINGKMTKLNGNEVNKEHSKKLAIVSKKFDKLKHALKKRAKQFSDGDVEITEEQDDRASNATAIDLPDNLIKQLKVTALYTARVIKSYEGIDRLFGLVCLEVDEIVFVTREESDGMCKGIVRDKYTQFPKHVLERLTHVEKFGSSSDERETLKDPEIEELIDPELIHDYEELQDFMSEHGRYLGRIRAERQAPAKKLKKQLSYLSPFANSCSVESGLDQITETTRNTQLRPLPIPPRKPMPIPKTEQRHTSGSHNSDGYVGEELHSLYNRKDQDVYDDATKQERNKTSTKFSHPEAMQTPTKELKTKLQKIREQAKLASQLKSPQNEDSDSDEHDDSISYIRQEKSQMKREALPPLPPKPLSPSTPPLPLKNKFKNQQRIEQVESDEFYISSSSFTPPSPKTTVPLSFQIPSTQHSPSVTPPGTQYHPLERKPPPILTKPRPPFPIQDTCRKDTQSSKTPITIPVLPPKPTSQPTGVSSVKDTISKFNNQN